MHDWLKSETEQKQRAGRKRLAFWLCLELYRKLQSSEMSLRELISSFASTWSSLSMPRMMWARMYGLHSQIKCTQSLQSHNLFNLTPSLYSTSSVKKNAAHYYLSVCQVHELERSRHALEVEAQSLREQTQELEEELSEAENSRLRLEVTLQALRAQFERELSAKEEKGEEKRRALNKQV